MDKNDIKLTDWMRILFGNVPLSFMFEVFIRTLIMYLILLVVMRFLGKRMAGQISVTELAVMLLLGAVVSAPMQLPDRGILQGAWLLVIILFLQRMVSWWGTKSAKAEKVTYGEATLLVKDGLIDVQAMLDTRISRPELFRSLRSKNIYQLGKVKRVYIEASGDISIYETDKEKPGLSTLPPFDEEAQKIYKEADKGLKACNCCANVQKVNNTETTQCDICHSVDWSAAVL